MFLAEDSKKKTEVEMGKLKKKYDKLKQKVIGSGFMEYVKKSKDMSQD